MDDLFPLFLKLSGRPCLVVGGGAVAEAKMQGLLRCGAQVRIVAQEATPGIREAAGAGRIAWEQRSFLPSDLAGIFLVVAATNSSELHEEIFWRCRQSGILCNAVDDPERCDFYYPAVVRRGALQLAISTAGLSPSLAQRLRLDLEEQFGPEYASWLEEIGRQRRELLQADISPENRRAILKELSSERAFQEFQARGKSGSQDGQGQDGRGKVYFVGAGPGDPELLTRKAWNILRSADVVLHDALVSSEILGIVQPDAILCKVGKRCGAKSITQEEIHALLIGYASSAKRVVRLQGGDPLIFGRAGEEISALREAGVDFEVIPGVTAASAAAAAAQIALTDRRFASELVFLSAHRREPGSPTHAGFACGGVEEPGSPTHAGFACGGVEEPGSPTHAARARSATHKQRPCAGVEEGEFERDLKSVPRAGATLVIYMPGSDYERLARALRDAGIAAETPCLIVSQVSVPQEAIYRTDVASLANLPAPPAPALLIVGEVVATAKAEDVLAIIGAA